MAKVKVRGKGSVYKMERGKSRGKCRKWQLRAEIDGEFEGDEGYVKTRVFHGTYSEAQDAKDEFVVLPPMYFPPFTPMIHNRSRQPAPAGYANVFPPLSAPPSNLSRNARASRARALSEPG